MFDFMVIGGGVAGLTAAAALSGEGRVLVWEAEDALGYHASGRSAAMFEENYGSAPVRALTRASRAAYEAQGVLSARGLYLVGLAGQEAQHEADSLDMGLHPVSLSDARARIPLLTDAVTRVSENTTAEDVDTDAVLQQAAKAVRAGGGAIETGRKVTGATRTTTGWVVRAGEHAQLARNVVIAAGAWADHVAALFDVTPLDLQPMRRSVARIAAPIGADVRNWPMMLGVGENWYAKPDAGAMLVSPAEEVPSAPCDAWADDMALAEGMDFYDQAIDAPLTRPMATWGGLRTFAPDRSLAIGPSDQPGVWWCAGQGGYGFQTAPGAAKFLADQVAGRPSDLDATTRQSLDPRRFL